MSNLKQYKADIIIDNTTGESFTSESGLARICGTNHANIANLFRKETDRKTAEIQTGSGVQSGKRFIKVYTESEIAQAIVKYNPKLAGQLMQLGVRTLMHKLAGYEVKSTAIQPMTPAQAALYTLQLAIDTEARVTRLELFAPHKDYYTVLAYINLNLDISKPASFSAAGKALTALSKSLNVEIKKVPDAKYGNCNAYHTRVLEAYFNA